MNLPHTLVSILPENNRLERIWKLAQVDFKKRFYNDRLGILWALLHPLIKVCIYYVVFTYFIPRAVEGVENFALFLFSALIFWLAFNELLTKGMNTLSQKSYLIENIRVDKVDLYLSHGLSSFLGFCFNLAAYMIIATLFSTPFSFQVLWLIFPIVSIYLLGLGFAMILSIIYIFISDVTHVIDMALLLGFWSSGILFPVERVVSIWPPIYYISPFLGIFYNVRALLVYDLAPDYIIMTINLAYAMIVFAIGSYLMRKYGHLYFERIVS